MNRSILAWLVIPALAVFAPTRALADRLSATCFPDCRDGFVCSPTGTCVSECNPVCPTGEACSDGTCHGASSQPGGAGAVTRSAPAPEHDPFVRISARASGVYQYWKISGKALGTFGGSNTSVGGIAGGVELAVDRYHLVLAPRVAVVFGAESQIEIGVDVGPRFARSLSSGRLGIDLLFTPMLFPGVASEGQGFYYGGRADVFFERGRFRVVVGAGYGHIATFKPDATVNSFELGLALAL